MLFYNCHHGCQLTIIHSILFYFVLCLFFHSLQRRCQWYNCLLTSAVQRFNSVIILQKYLDYKHIGFIVVIYSLMVFDEHKVNTRFWCTHSRRIREIVDGLCETVAVAHSVMTCHCKAYPNTNYTGRHIILIFCQMKNGGHNCERSVMVTL